MLTTEQLANLKVGDVIFDLKENKTVVVCGCLFLVRNRIAYVKENPHEFQLTNPLAQTI
jgi:hypothetical protein